MNTKHFFIVAVCVGSLNGLHALQTVQAQQQEPVVKAPSALLMRILKTLQIMEEAESRRRTLEEPIVAKLNLEWRMIDEARSGTLTKENLDAYLKGGADINAREDYGNTALSSAAYKGHTDTVQLLITAGADINANKRGGGTALHSAALGNHKEVVQLLVAHGADVDAKNDYGDTALSIVAGWGHTEVAQLLVTKGADIEAKNCNGITALMEAARQINHRVYPICSFLAILQILIAHGADVDAKDHYGRTARDIAENKKAYDEVVAAGLKEYEEYQEKIKANADMEEKDNSVVK